MKKKIPQNKKQIQEEILDLRKSLLNFNFQKSSGQLEKTSQIRNTRRQIARLKSQLTLINGGGDA